VGDELCPNYVMQIKLASNKITTSYKNYAWTEQGRENVRLEVNEHNDLTTVTILQDI